LRGRALTIAVVLTILLTAQAQPVLQAQETEGASPLQQTLERLDLPQRIEESFLKIPRSFFLPDQLHSFANEDQPIPLYSGAIVPDFSSVAVLVGEMAIRSDSRILVVGRGCGFFAAIAATLAARVEVVEALDAQAEIYPERWEELGLENVVLASQEEAFEREYDGIMVHAATDSIPPRIISVLGEGGRLVAPLTDGSGNQVLTVFFRDGEKLSVSTAGEVFFPPGQKVF
jgi:protein-L-isoaspartate(D-aspartate) O-methyltransferase